MRLKVMLITVLVCNKDFVAILFQHSRIASLLNI